MRLFDHVPWSVCVCVIWGLAIATIWRGLCRRAQRETAAGCCWCCWKWRFWLIHRLRFHADLESSKALIGSHTLQFLHRPNLIVAACTKTISWPQCVKSAAKLGRLATTRTGGACAGSSVAPPLASLTLHLPRSFQILKFRKDAERNGAERKSSFTFLPGFFPRLLCHLFTSLPARLSPFHFPFLFQRLFFV